MRTAQSEAGTPAGIQPAKPLRILIADDERDMVDTLTALLKGEGHIVHAVYTGKAVMSAAALFMPDVLLCDLAISGVSGYAIAQSVRNSYVDGRRPLLIAMSGFWREKPDQRMAAQVGFDHHLVKPFDTAELLELLK
jgi:two-component system, chemotaxis family, CheB/CheR fusion protein